MTGKARQPRKSHIVYRKFHPLQFPNFGVAGKAGFGILAFRFCEFNRRKFMSQHRSLRAATTLGGRRNVLKRFERTELLKKRGQWKDGDRITGLRKTKPES